jgi:predicted ATP-grasp superfamily ATP-dependent carboligase
MSDRPRVLITNAEERSMLASCRSLHKAGFEVTCVSASALACASFSRACARRVRIVDPREDSVRFLAQLRDELSHHPCQMLIPGSDSALLAISDGREHLLKLTNLGLPSKATVGRALDRSALAESAAHAGLASASSVRCAGPEDALDAAAQLGFPVVLKSTQAASLRLGRAIGAPKSRPVRDAADLQALAPLFGEPLVVQRQLSGELLSFGGVFAGGALLASAVSRYKRTWPPPGGSVSFSQTIDPPDGLEEGVRALLDHIGWEGIFELELIRSERDTFVPIDLNPRPYGSMALACAAGAPLPAIWCAWLLSEEASRPARAAAGQLYRWEDGELGYMLWQARHGDFRAALRPLRPYRRVTHASFERVDPLPLFAQGGHLAHKTLRRWGAPQR